MTDHAKSHVHHNPPPRPASPATLRYAPCDTLPNGATVHASALGPSGEIVLARRNGEWVTWLVIARNGQTVDGHYCGLHLLDGLDDFERRVAGRSA